MHSVKSDIFFSLVYGVFMGADLKMSPITSCNLSLPDLAEEGSIPGVFNVIFSGQVMVRSQSSYEIFSLFSLCLA